MEKLGMVPFFQVLSADDLRQVNRKFSARHYRRNETIYMQDEAATMLRVVVAGKVRLVRHTLEGKDILLDMLKPGDYFGSLSTGKNNVYPETAIAHTDACVLSIRLSEFRTILNTFPQVAVSVLDITANRLRASREKIQRLTTLPVEGRIASILLSLADKFGEQSEHGLLLQLPLSRKDLADMAGTSTETASRIMSQFQEDGLITSGRQWVAVNDKAGLEEISSE